MGGIDVFHRLREINPAVKVILVSGYLDPALKNDMLTAGAKGFVQKPYALGDMLRKLRDVIDLQEN
jgi:DNA-binding NarL/FixJ family response regulator